MVGLSGRLGSAEMACEASSFCVCPLRILRLGSVAKAARLMFIIMAVSQVMGGGAGEVLGMGHSIDAAATYFA